MAAYLDDEVDQVEVFYNGYASAISQVVRRETLLPLQRATVLEEEPPEEAGLRVRPHNAASRRSTSPTPSRC